uniref:Uncharacterized protein n=1 Tax=Cacopsylla melanoneura TaxID=428564 RepID=A0A8D8LC72_9HEMI
MFRVMENMLAPMILGTSWMRKHQAVLDMPRAILTLGHPKNENIPLMNTSSQRTRINDKIETSPVLPQPSSNPPPISLAISQPACTAPHQLSPSTSTFVQRSEPGIPAQSPIQDTLQIEAPQSPSSEIDHPHSRRNNADQSSQLTPEKASSSQHSGQSTDESYKEPQENIDEAFPLDEHRLAVSDQQCPDTPQTENESIALHQRESFINNTHHEASNTQRYITKSPDPKRTKTFKILKNHPGIQPQPNLSPVHLQLQPTLHPTHSDFSNPSTKTSQRFLRRENIQTGSDIADLWAPAIVICCAHTLPKDDDVTNQTYSQIYLVHTINTPKKRNNADRHQPSLTNFP